MGVFRDQVKREGMQFLARNATKYLAIWDPDNPVIQERGRGNPVDSVRSHWILEEALEEQVWGSRGEGLCPPKVSGEGSRLAVGQYRLSSERGREL